MFALIDIFRLVCWCMLLLDWLTVSAFINLCWTWIDFFSYFFRLCNFGTVKHRASVTLFHKCFTPILVILECPHDWHKSRFDTCYKFVSTRKSWPEAQRDCVRMGGGLAVIDTSAKALDIARIRSDTGK